jgi:tetratricopeptide (TPR) repeat protein
MQFGHAECPRCGSNLTTERLIGSSLVCECGWSKSTQAESKARISLDRTCSAIVMIGGVLIAAFLQAVNWDKHALVIIPLKTKQMAGIATAKDLNQIAEICFERKKFDCVERAYFQIAKKEPRNLTNLARLGDLQLRLGQKSIDTLTMYFSLKGDDLNAVYNYAMALSREKRYDQATRYFEIALAAKPDILQVTVIRHYVNMLMEAGRNDQAKQVILEYRKKSATADLFMAKELEQILTASR